MSGIHSAISVIMPINSEHINYVSLVEKGGVPTHTSTTFWRCSARDADSQPPARSIAQTQAACGGGVFECFGSQNHRIV